MPAIAHLGDGTSHGGTVITASGDVYADGRQVARVGDLVMCPKRDTPDGPIHGIVPIVSGAATVMVNGRPAALSGSLCSCGAAVISGGTVLVE